MFNFENYISHKKLYTILTVFFLLADSSLFIIFIFLDNDCMKNYLITHSHAVFTCYYNIMLSYILMYDDEKNEWRSILDILKHLQSNRMPTGFIYWHLPLTCNGVTIITNRVFITLYCCCGILYILLIIILWTNKYWKL